MQVYFPGMQEWWVVSQKELFSNHAFLLIPSQKMLGAGKGPSKL